MIRGKVYVTGQIVDPAEAKISVFDRGFLFGDSIFETMRIYDTVPFKLAEHLTRLGKSGQRIGFELPWTQEHIRDAISRTQHASGLPNAYLRLICTRGSGPLGLDPSLASHPQLVIFVTELPSLPPEMYEKGKTAQLVSISRHSGAGTVDPQAKTGNYLNSVMAAREAHSFGADEAIMLGPDGRIAEASAANVFALVDGAWCTPPLDVGILSGITRHSILTLCAEHGIMAREHSLWPADLERANELFLCASVREIIPIVKLNGRPVGDGVVGPETRRLRQFYAATVQSYVARHRVH